MEDWVRRALEKWPNVPDLFGWLHLDRRGQWFIRGELITRPQIIDTIARNYAADTQGRWYFQNGPQRGYVSLETAPLVLRAQPDGRLFTHTSEIVRTPQAAYLDEEGSLLLLTEHGPAALDAADLDWALSRLTGRDGAAITESDIEIALERPSGAVTALELVFDTAHRLPLRRLDSALAPAQLDFVRDPQPDTKPS